MTRPARNYRRRLPTVETLTRELRQGERTANELSQLTGIDFFGVSSCLVGMRRRREVLRTIPKPGKPAVWRLTSN